MADWIRYNSMDDVCRLCNEQGETICLCNPAFNFCYHHAHLHIEISEGNHDLIFLSNIDDKLLKIRKLNFEGKNQTSNIITYDSNWLKNLESESIKIDQKQAKKKFKIAIGKSSDISAIQKQLKRSTS